MPPGKSIKYLANPFASAGVCIVIKYPTTNKRGRYMSIVGGFLALLLANSIIGRKEAIIKNSLKYLKAGLSKSESAIRSDHSRRP